MRSAIRPRVHPGTSMAPVSRRRVFGVPPWTLLTIALAVGCTAGCGKFSFTPPDSKQEARQRWSQVRSQMKLQLAEGHLRAGRLADAEAQIKDALALDPKLTAGHVLAARLSLERGELAAARSSLNSAIEIGGESAETDYLLGVLAEWSGDLEAALNHFRQAAQRGPLSPDTIVAECDALVALDRADEALGLVQRHRADFAGNQAICLLDGDIHTLRGQYAEAADAYREVAMAAPGDPQAQIQYGTALTRCGRYEQAIGVLAPQLTASKNLSWAACQALGRSYLERGNAAAAVEVFRDAARRYPTDTGPWLWLARAAARQGDWAAARQNAEKACQMDSRNAAARMLLGYACLRGGDLAQARASLDSVLRESPNDWLGHYLLGQVLEAAGRKNEALAHYRLADQADANEPAARDLLATTDLPPAP
jgi:Tfp pilus assembly protein PilF